MERSMSVEIPESSDHPTILHGDCVEQLGLLPDNSVDAVVTDPPYGLAFMGKEWDAHPSNAGFQEWCETWLVECLRVLKPGGHLLAFGGTRTWHRLTCAVEDAGFEIRDSIAWMYGSGFPKSLNVGKAIESQILNGASNPRALRKTEQEGDGESYQLTGKNNGILGETRVYDRKTFSPNTDEAKQWDGWGTALKPAFEPIVVARKPLTGTVAANVLEHGTGALNVDGCRIGSDEDTRRNARGGDNGLGGTGTFQIRERRAEDMPETSGRWPANVVLDEYAAAELDRQSGTSTSKIGKPRGTAKRGMFANSDFNKVGAEYDDTGGASRFFYTAKASKRERPDVDGVATHPTVKPLAIMRWLVRLVTQPGGLVLDPFAGSGTTVEACMVEGFRCVAVEREAEYLPLIEARISRNNLSLFAGRSEA